jgi:GAF domain-containing protein/anti-sigma regulatory factor (Ser/Thr protein kinase)
MHDGNRIDPDDIFARQGSVQRVAGLLREAVHELRASNAALFFADESETALKPVLVVGDPLSLFTTPRQILISDDRYIAAAAFRERRQVVRDFPGADRLDVTMPFPYLVVATPVVAEDHPPGILTFIWTLPKEAVGITAPDSSRCTETAKKLTQEKELLAALRNTSHPLFLLTSSGTRATDAAGSSLLFQTRTLEAALTGATGLKDVASAVMEHMAEPSGAEKMALALFEGDRLRVIGQRGFPRTMLQPVMETEEAGMIACSRGALFCESEETVQAAKLGVGFGSSLKAGALLPLVSGGQAVGALLLGFTRSRPFPAEERAWLVTMAGMVSVALERAHLFDTAHATAQELQQGLLPRHVPQLKELDTTARYFTASASTTGGDWYDVLVLPDGRVGLFIGDAEGHTVASAALMGQVRTALQAYAAEGHGPAEVLTRTNALLLQLGAEMFVTCCCVWVDRIEGTAEIASAGHLGPLIRMARDEVVSVSVELIGPPLMVAADTVYQATQVTLQPGATLALFTNGLVRSHSADLSSALEAISGILSAPQGYLEDIADRICAPAAEAHYREDDAALLLAVYRGAQLSAGHHVVHLSVRRHDLQALGDVRQFVRDQLTTWAWGSKSDEAELLTTELVTNALIHADSEVDLWLREQQDRLRVDVCDWDPRPPVPAPITFTEEFESEAEHGRGLLIVEALASAWGKAPRGRGKSVWFELQRD